jgi:hypothetical protein
MFEFIKTKKFHYLFSFLLGIFAVIIWRPVCNDDTCIKHKLPNLDEINKSTYQIGSKCYQFRSVPIESFRSGKK